MLIWHVNYFKPRYIPISEHGKFGKSYNIKVDIKLLPTCYV